MVARADGDEEEWELENVREKWGNNGQVRNLKNGRNCHDNHIHSYLLKFSETYLLQLATTIYRPTKANRDSKDGLAQDARGKENTKATKIDALTHRASSHIKCQSIFIPHLYQVCRSWNLAAKMLLPLFLLNFKSKSWAKYTLSSQETKKKYSKDINQSTYFSDRGVES